MTQKFYEMTPAQRRESLIHQGVDAHTLTAMAEPESPSLPTLDVMSENVVGAWQAPLGILTRCLVNRRVHRVAMSTEEPSVVAAANRAARLFDDAGGVVVRIDEPVTCAQIMVAVHTDAVGEFLRQIETRRDQWIALANACDPALVRAGGGAFDFDVTTRTEEHDETLVVARLFVHTKDAMGANAVNTMAEKILHTWTERCALSIDGFDPGMAILTNDGAGRLVTAEIVLPPGTLRRFVAVEPDVFVRKMARASRFAECDPQRAVTHNKGIMNGIIAAAIPLGQDTRAIEAAAYHYACRDGHHAPLAVWAKDPSSGGLRGRLCMPLCVGFIGAFRASRAVEAAFRFDGIDDYPTLCALLAATGLAQNFGALWALVTSGIQEGHMKLHRRKCGEADPLN